MASERSLDPRGTSGCWQGARAGCRRCGLEPKEEVQLVREVHSQLPLRGTVEGRVVRDGGAEGDDVGLRW